MISTEHGAPVLHGSAGADQRECGDISISETVRTLRKMTARSVYERLAVQAGDANDAIAARRDALNAAYLGCVLRYAPQTHAAAASSRRCG